MGEKEMLAYWAGFVDSDGSINIGITKAKRKDGTIRTYPFIRVQIYNTYKPIIEKAKTFFKCGSIAEQSKQTKPINFVHWSKKPQYYWNVTCNNALQILKRLLPYLQVKKEQAQLAIELQEHIISVKNKWRGKRNQDGSYMTTPQEEIKFREKLIHKISTLNKGEI